MLSLRPVPGHKAPVFGAGMNRMGDGVSKLDQLHSIALCVRCQYPVQRSHVACPQFQRNGKMQGITGTQAVIVQPDHFRSPPECAATDRNNAQATLCQQLELLAHPLCVGRVDLAGAQLDRQGAVKLRQ